MGAVQKKFFLSILILGTIYFLGPAPQKPTYNSAMPSIPAIDSLDQFISTMEVVHKLRPDNQARVVWAQDTLHQKTAYSIVYLHGFSASQEEGNPVHRNIARYFGCNLYLARLAEHGLDTTDMLIRLTVDNYWESAKQALAIGKQLGHKVILMGTSTGATQALQLAATYPNDIAGLILYSPNIEINNPGAVLLNNHWGLQISRLVMGGKYNPYDTIKPDYHQYWSNPYRLEAAVELQEMLETALTEDNLKKINQPMLMLYYYKNEKEQDPVVKVSAMEEMFQKISTTKALKREKALPNTGNHILASPIRSKDIISVEMETKRFLLEIMKLKPTNTKDSI